MAIFVFVTHHSKNKDLTYFKTMRYFQGVNFINSCLLLRFEKYFCSSSHTGGDDLKWNDEVYHTPRLF